jgi:hypothetical protein
MESIMTRSAAIRRAYTLPKGSQERRKLLAHAKRAGGINDLDPRKWYISTEDGDTYGPYSSQTEAGDDGDDAFQGTTEFVVERGDKVKKSIRDPKGFGLFSPKELLKNASGIGGDPIRRWKGGDDAEKLRVIEDTVTRASDIMRMVTIMAQKTPGADASAAKALTRQLDNYVMRLL